VTSATFDRVLQTVPEVAHAVHLSADGTAVVPGDLLEVCRLRVAMLLGNEALLAEARVQQADLVADLPNWPTSSRFSTAQRACLALTEEFVIDVASSSDESLAAVTAELGEQGMADFVSALLITEQRQRLAMMWERLGV
jgi:hypothetical protein